MRGVDFAQFESYFGPAEPMTIAPRDDQIDIPEGVDGTVAVLTMWNTAPGSADMEPV